MDAAQLMCIVCAAAAVANALCGRVRRRLCARPPHRPRPYRQRRPRVHVPRASAYAPKLPTPVAACNMRQETDSMQHATCNMQHATCNMQRTTSLLRPSHVWQVTRDLCRAASCSATGAVVRQATRAVGITPPPPLTHPPTHNTPKQKDFSTMPRRLRRIGRNRIGAEKDQRRRPCDEYLAQYRLIVVPTWYQAGTTGQTDVHGEGDAPRQTPDAAARPATPNSIWLSGRKGELALRGTCLRERSVPVHPSLCAAQHCVRVRTLRCR
jgi:hypothetical protein